MDATHCQNCITMPLSERNNTRIVHGNLSKQTQSNLDVFEGITRINMSIFQGKKDSKEEAIEKVEQFVAKDPLGLYLIDGEKGVERSVICRTTTNGGKTCLNLDIDGVTLFKKMQEAQFFCSLPSDVTSTHFECRKIQ